jgi:hypothetical protein
MVKARLSRVLKSGQMAANACGDRNCRHFEQRFPGDLPPRAPGRRRFSENAAASTR